MAIPLPDETIKDLWSAVARARKRMERDYKTRWDRNLALYQGHHWRDSFDMGDGPDSGGLKEVTVNKTGEGIAIKWTSDTAVPPRFEVTPRQSGGDPLQRPLLSEFITRHFVGAGGCWPAAQAARLDMLIYGTGVVAVGWRPGTEEAVPQDPAAASDAAGQAEDQYNTLASNPGVDAGDFTGPDIVDTFAIKGETAFAYRVSPYDLIIPLEARWDNWPSQADFIGRVYVTTRAQLDAAGYDTDGIAGDDKFSTTHAGFLLDPIYADLSGDEHTEYVVMAEVWFRGVPMKRSFTDTDENGAHRYPPNTYPIRVLWAVADPDHPLRVELWPYDPRDDQEGRVFPFMVAVNREVPGKFFGIGDPELAEQPQEAINLAASLAMTHLNQAREKILTPKGILDEDAIAALESNEPLAVVEVEHPAPAGVIVPMQRTNATLEYQPTILAHKEDLNALTGVTDAARGNPLPGEQTATEARLVNQLSSGRSAKDSSKFEDLLCWIAGATWQLKCQFGNAGDSVTYRLPRRQADQPQVQTTVLDHTMLVPIDVLLKTGATRVSDQLQKIQRMMGFGQFVALINQFASILNPSGHVDIAFFLEELAQASDFTSDLDRLFDTSAIQQQAAAMQQQAALMGGGLLPGAPGPPGAPSVAGGPALPGPGNGPPQARGVPSPTGSPFPLLPNGRHGPSQGV